MGKTLKIAIGKKDMRVEADGFMGVGCDEAVRAFVAKIGAELTSETHKSEYYELEQSTEQETG